MGIKASSTCVMTFEEAEGYLIGDLYKGVTNMFTMMNSERVAVGNQGLGVGEASYQNAVAYARERLQGRSLSGIKCPDKPADPIIWHPDVRRMLLTMKALNEGNRMLASWVAFHLDLAHRGTNEEEKKAADDFVQLMTPIVKAYLTDCGVDITNLGLQVFGGHGYIRDYGMEQYVRDARIAQIYEGTNGVQSLDLAGRKMPAHMGRYLRPFFHFVSQFIEDQQQDKSLQEFIDPLAKAFGRLQQATLTIAQKGIKAPDEAGAASTDYLKMFGLVASAYLWVRAVLVARQKTESNEKVFYEGKIATARFFHAEITPPDFFPERIHHGRCPSVDEHTPGSFWSFLKIEGRDCESFIALHPCHDSCFFSLHLSTAIAKCLFLDQHGIIVTERLLKIFGSESTFPAMNITPVIQHWNALEETFKTAKNQESDQNEPS
jgi:hypothetical protein